MERERGSAPARLRRSPPEYLWLSDKVGRSALFIRQLKILPPEASAAGRNKKGPDIVRAF